MIFSWDSSVVRGKLMGKKFIDLCIKDSFMFPAVVTDVEIDENIY